MTNKPSLDVLLIVVAALLFRVSYVIQIQDHPLFSYHIMDAAGFDRWADRILAGHWAASADDDPGMSAAAMPIYPFFLASIQALFGKHWLIIRLVQTALGTCTCILLYALTRQLFDRQTGLCAGLLLALYPPAAFYDALIQKGVIGQLCLVVMMLGVALVSQRTHWGIALLIGLFLGVSGLERENNLLLLPVILLYLWTCKVGTPRTERLKLCTAALLGCALVFGVVGVRNVAGGRGFQVNAANFGPNFYAGNHQGATGIYGALIFGHQDPKHERRDARLLAERHAQRELSDSEVSRYWSGRAIDAIAQDVPAWLRLMARKLLLTWNQYEVPDTEDIYVHGDWSWLLGWTLRGWHFGILAPLAVFGAVLSWPNRRSLWLFYCIPLVITVSVAAFFVYGRYRYPMIPGLVLFAAYGLIHGARTILADRRLQPVTIVACVAAIAMAACANWPQPQLAQLKGSSYANLGTVYYQQGHLKGAQAFFERALSIAPRSPAALYGAGSTLFTQGSYEQAGSVFQTLIEVAPQFNEGQLAYARTLAKLSRADLADAHLANLIEMSPQFLPAYLERSALLLEQGRAYDAQTLLRAGLQQAERHNDELSIREFKERLGSFVDE